MTRNQELMHKLHNSKPIKDKFGNATNTIQDGNTFLCLWTFMLTNGTITHKWKTLLRIVEL